MIQFIILYVLDRCDEPLSYPDLLNLIQDNCEIVFTDLQLGLDNLVDTGHVSSNRVTDIQTLYDITQKGKNVIDFFYSQIPLIIREPIDSQIKSLYIEKRRREAVRADIVPINLNEYNAECELRDDDKVLLLSLKLYAGSRTEAERIAEYFKTHSDTVYRRIIETFTSNGKEESNEQTSD